MLSYGEYQKGWNDLHESPYKTIKATEEALVIFENLARFSLLTGVAGKI